MVAVIGGIGGWEVILVLALALVIFGPKRLPELARSLGKLSRDFRVNSRKFQQELMQDLDPPEARPAAPPRPATRHVERGSEPDAPEPPARDRRPAAGEEIYGSGADDSDGVGDPS